MNKYWKSFGLYAVMFVIVLGILAFLNTNNASEGQGSTQYTYSDLIEKIENDEIAKISVEKSSEANDYGFVTAVTNDGTTFRTSLVSFSSFMDFINGKIVAGLLKAEIVDMPKVSVLSRINWNVN